MLNGGRPHINGSDAFSSSDGTNLNINGPTYAARVGAVPPRGVAFGSGHMGFVLLAAASPVEVEFVTRNLSTYEIDEVFQSSARSATISVCLGNQATKRASTIRRSRAMGWKASTPSFSTSATLSAWGRKAGL